jgi:hypothetical protein
MLYKVKFFQQIYLDLLEKQVNLFIEQHNIHHIDYKTCIDGNGKIHTIVMIGYWENEEERERRH